MAASPSQCRDWGWGLRRSDNKRAPPTCWSPRGSRRGQGHPWSPLSAAIALCACPGTPCRRPGRLRLRDGVAGSACRGSTLQSASSGTRNAPLTTPMSSFEVKTAQMNWKMFYLYFSHIPEPLFPWFKSLHCLIADFHL